MTGDLPSPENVFRHVPCFCGVLLIAARAVARLYNQELRCVGLEGTQYSMLSVLKSLGSMAVGELGDRLAVDKTTISRNVKVLERNGWVAVERGGDARERIVSITNRGARKLSAARPHWERAQRLMKEALPAGWFESIRHQLPDVAMAAMRR